MSVHTLQVKDGAVVLIGANVAKHECLRAARTILEFCCEVEGVAAPIVVFPARVKPGQDTPDGPIGGIGVRGGKVVIDTTCGHCGDDLMFRLEPDEADQTAAQLAAHAANARNEPTEAEVAELAQLLRDCNPSADEWKAAGAQVPAAAWARNLLRAGYGKAGGDHG